jgi:hypothetical protein
MHAPSHYQGTFGGGASDTVMHPLVAGALLVTIGCLFCLPRKYALVPLLLALFLLPVGQQLHLGGVHLYVPRIIFLFGFGVLAMAKVRSPAPVLAGGWKGLDTIFTLWALFRATAVTCLYWGQLSVLLNQAAFLWDSLGAYFLFRYLIRTPSDIERLAKTFAIIVGFLAVGMVNEHFRHLNVFGYLGGVQLFPSLRAGSIRAQGPFEHPLLAGSFAATLFPIFLWIWHGRSSRALAVVGIIGCSAMVVASASSTPLLAYLAVVVGVCAWPLRRSMQAVRWSAVIILLLAQLIMKAPAWFLISHVDLVAGNSGWHRAMLIDTFIRHFGDWWLFGTNQAVTWGLDMDDLCEQWVQEGETGGIITLFLFIALIAHMFRRLGVTRARMSGNRTQEWLIWLIGVALFSHCIAFFGISYFDQSRFAFFALISVISVITDPASCPGPSRISTGNVSLQNGDTPHNLTDAANAVTWSPSGIPHHRFVSRSNEPGLGKTPTERLS